MDNKNIDFKNAQNSLFSKRVCPWFLSKIWNFLNVSFYAKNTAKKCLVTFWLKNKPV